MNTCIYCSSFVVFIHCCNNNSFINLSNKLAHCTDTIHWELTKKIKKVINCGNYNMMYALYEASIGESRELKYTWVTSTCAKKSTTFAFTLMDCKEQVLEALLAHTHDSTHQHIPFFKIVTTLMPCFFFFLRIQQRRRSYP